MAHIQTERPGFDNQNVNIGWYGTFTLEKEQAVLAGPPGSTFQWYIKNRSGKTIDVELTGTLGNPPNGKNIPDGSDRTMTLAVPGHTTHAVYDYKIKVTEKDKPAVTETFEDPWIVVF